MHGTCSKSSGELSPDGVSSRALKKGREGAEGFVPTKSGNVRHWKGESSAFFLDCFRPFFVSLFKDKLATFSDSESQATLNSSLDIIIHAHTHIYTHIYLSSLACVYICMYIYTCSFFVLFCHFQSIFISITSFSSSLSFAFFRVNAHTRR